MDKEMFVEAMIEVFSSLSPTFYIMIAISISITFFNIFKNLVFDSSSSCGHVNIEEDDEEYVDEDDREFEYKYNYNYSVLDNNSDPIKSVKR